jgi:hypothetical protein
MRIGAQRARTVQEDRKGQNGQTDERAKAHEQWRILAIAPFPSQ